jgi:hypothetical protein
MFLKYHVVNDVVTMVSTTFPLKLHAVSTARAVQSGVAG